MKTDKIRIGIAEDHDLVRQGFVKMLADYEDMEVLFEVGNGKELLKCIKKFKPGIILLDIEMPVLGGIDAMEKIKQNFPKVKIIVVSAYAEDSSVVEYVKRGADCFLTKNTKMDALAAAIRAVHEQGSYFENHVLRLLASKGTFLPGRLVAEKARELTEREITILKYICENRPHQEIAEAMGLNLKTIDWYKHKLMHKTNASSAEGLLSYAIKRQLIQGE